MNLARLVPLRILFWGMDFFARRFIAGNGPQDILNTVGSRRRKGFLTSLSVLGEGMETEEEARRHARFCFSLIRGLGSVVPSEEPSLSLKCSALDALSPGSVASGHSAGKVVERAIPIFKALDRAGGHAYLDAEEYALEELRFAVFQNLYSVYKSGVRFVLQAYLRDASRTLASLALINDPKHPIWVRLVRGAYWEHELYRAKILGLAEPPVWTSKADTDRNYDLLFRRGLELGLVMIPATHNIESLISCTPRAPEIQVLFGLGDEIAKVLLKRGVKVRIYMPVLYPQGSWRDGLSYLLRRISESQTSFVFQNSGREFKRKLKRLEEAS